MVEGWHWREQVRRGQVIIDVPRPLTPVRPHHSGCIYIISNILSVIQEEIDSCRYWLLALSWQRGSRVLWQRPRSLPPFATKRAESALADPKLIHFQTLLVLNREKTRYDKTSQLHLLLKRPGNEADLTVSCCNARSLRVFWRFNMGFLRSYVESRICHTI